MISTQNNVMSQSGGSVYVPPSEATPDNIWRIFSGRLSYDKGAAIIHVLRHELNDDTLFLKSLIPIRKPLKTAQLLATTLE